MRTIWLVIALAAAGATHAASRFTFSPEPGKYAVGMREVQQYDQTRVFRPRFDPLTGHPWVGEIARPIQTLIWYPATGGGARLDYRDYVATAVTEQNFSIPADDARKLAGPRVTNNWQVDGAVLQSELDRPMWAVRDAKPLEGKYPVVIYAPSFGASASESADLCEYLASQGYVVLSSPSLGATAKGQTHDVAGIDAQAADIEFLIAYARSLPQADLDRLAVMGYSWGGISNVFAASRDSRIKALVALDGSIRYFPKLAAEGVDVNGSTVTVPMLYVAARSLPVEDNVAYGVDVSGSFLNQMKYSDVYRVTMTPMDHANFSAEFQRFAADERFVEYSREETSQAYGWMARYVVAYLNAYLKQDPAGMAFLAAKPATVGVPDHMAMVDIRRAKGEAPVLQTFVAQLGKRGFDKATDVYHEMTKTEPSFKLDEETLRHWGYQLLFAGETKKAINIFQLTADIYPDSWNAFDCLAEAYARDGNKPMAIKNYRQSLALGPQNVNAVHQLQALGAKP